MKQYKIIAPAADDRSTIQKILETRISLGWITSIPTKIMGLFVSLSIIAIIFIPVAIVGFVFYLIASSLDDFGPMGLMEYALLIIMAVVFLLILLLFGGLALAVFAGAGLIKGILDGDDNTGESDDNDSSSTHSSAAAISAMNTSIECMRICQR